jgi:signal transduction histidine kinase
MAAMQAGAMDYLIKGRIDADRLERSIRYALARKKVERQKDDFVATVNHELRTPITSIKGSLGIALHAYGEAIPEEVHEMLEVAVRNCERLIRIVNDLLDVQKVQSGKLELEVTPLDVDALIEQAVAANEGYAHAQGVSLFTASNIEAGTQIEGDEGRLLQVMANLLSNAIKYSPGGGVVTVNAEEAGGAVRIEIIDDGPGIPEEFRSSVFGRFEQASESKGKQVTSGLGLNIARSLVDLHNGEIGFETEMGSGTTFYFTLPLMKTVASF